MIHRLTTWVTETGEELQVSLALLDDSWEPLCEFTRPCGPFHEMSDQVLELRDELRRWMHRCGYQLELGS